jgi:hypothetical protein
VELSSVPLNGDGPFKAFGMPGGATVARRPSSRGGDHGNIFATTTVAPCPATTLPPARSRYGTPQAIDLHGDFALQIRLRLASLSRSGVFRARTRTRSWRDQDVQQPTSFVWSPTRPPNRLCLRRRSPIHASSTWSGCWLDRLHGTSFKPKQTTGRETASRSKEVAS